jgi:hypothetical protein
VTPEERAEIERRAREAGLNISDFFRGCISKAPLPRRRNRAAHVDLKALAAAIAEVNRLNDGLNEIAHELNRQKFLPGGGIVAQALRGDGGALLGLQAIKQFLEESCAGMGKAMQEVRAACDENRKSEQALAGRRTWRAN